MKSAVPMAFRACVRRVANPKACTPRGYEWIPGYLNQYGGQMTDYGRNWLLAKWEEPYRDALQTAEREYQECLKGGLTDATETVGLRLHVLSGLDALSIRRAGQSALALSGRVNVHFRPGSASGPPCDPFDPEASPTPVDPDAPTVSVPRAVFWKSVSATYDLDALTLAMRPVSPNLNLEHPLALRDLCLAAEDVKAAVRILGHRFLPIPAGVHPEGGVRVDLEVASIRLDITSEWASNGVVLNEWFADSPPYQANSDAYTDFQCYYLGCAWWASPPPVFDWGLVPPGCLADLVFRALPTAITYVQVSASTGALLGRVTLGITNAGTIDSRPIVARHRIFNSPGSPHQVEPGIMVGPAPVGQTVEVSVPLPDCLVGKVELAPAASQDYSLFQQDGVIGVEALEGASPETLNLRLTLARPVYHWDRDVDIRFIPQGGVDFGYPPSGWWPHVVLRVPVAWNGCDAFQPDTDSTARIVSVGWAVADTFTTSPRWLHQMQLRVVDYAPPANHPCGGFDCVWGYVRVTWPDDVLQTQQIYCVAGDIDLPRTFTHKLASEGAPTVSVELELYYEASNRRRKADGSGFDTLPVPGPLVRQQTLTP